MPPLVEIRDLRIAFGATQAVRGIDLALEESEVLGLVGESGSGKGNRTFDSRPSATLSPGLRTDPVWRDRASPAAPPRTSSTSCSRIRARFISHDLAVVVMRFVESGPVREGLTRPQHEYTRSLLAAVLTLRTDRDQPMAIVGNAAK